MLLKNHEAKNRSSSYYRDGLVDIFIGLGIIVAGLYIWADMAWMAGTFVPIFLPTWKAARKRFEYRRAGVPVYNPRLEAQRQKVLLYVSLLIGGLLVAGIGFLAFGLLPSEGNAWLTAHFLLLLGVMFSSAWIFAAAMLRVKRFSLYALSTFLTFATAQYTDLPFGVALVITGGLILLVGSGVFLSFLQERPIQEKGV